MAFNKFFKIANPSTYTRNDYVEVELNLLGVPTNLNETSLKLSRLYPDGRKEEIPYQIDYILGKEREYRSLTFLSGETQPSGSDRYDRPSASFLLEEATPGRYMNEDTKNNLWIEHYYPGNPMQVSRDFLAGESVIGVKLNNTRLCFFLCLVPSPEPGKNPEINFTGAVTSLEFKDLLQLGIVAEMLSYDYRIARKKWGQLTHISFFPLPWQLEGFEKISLLDKKHELVYSHSGPVRAVVTVKCGPLEVTYNGAPLFDTGKINIRSHIYRILYIYKDSPYYIEELLSETYEGKSISFRPYFSSLLFYPFYASQLKRFEDIPDYFSIWKSFASVQFPGFANAVQSLGFGFAADAHVRQIELNADEICWRLPFSHHNKCVHYFMQHGVGYENVDLFHAIGQYGWYEKVFKPLEVLPYKKRFPAPALDDFEAGERI